MNFFTACFKSSHDNDQYTKPDQYKEPDDSEWNVYDGCQDFSENTYFGHFEYGDEEYDNKSKLDVHAYFASQTCRVRSKSKNSSVETDENDEKFETESYATYTSVQGSTTEKKRTKLFLRKIFCL